MQRASEPFEAQGSNPATHHGVQHRDQDHPARVTSIRRRNRLITSCLECRRRKLKCDKNHPCTNCSKFHRGCVYIAAANNEARQLKLTRIKEKVGSLERMLERDVLRGDARGQGGSLFEDGAGEVEEDEDEDGDDHDEAGPEDERDLQPTQLATDGVIYEDGVDTDIFDLGVQLGKMRVTERIGGYFRPRLAEEVWRSVYLVSTGLVTDGIQISDTLESPLVQPSTRNSESDFDTESFLMPGPTYLPPSCDLFIGSGLNHRSPLDFLPTKEAADELIRQYFNAVHVVVCLVHQQTFDQVYRKFWDQMSSGIEPAASTQALVFAAMFCGAVSMAEEMIIQFFGVGKRIILNNFQSGCEHALAKANVLRSMKLETIQAFVMYLVCNPYSMGHD